jgi:hypothetical protein
MGRLVQSDSSGLFALMVGLIALVMFGVLVTLRMDGSVGLSQGEDLQVVCQTGKARKVEATKRRDSLLAKKAQRRLNGRRTGNSPPSSPPR